MENEASNLEEWIHQLARDIHAHRHNHSISTIRTQHPALQRIATVLDARSYACAGDASENAGDDTPQHIGVHENGDGPPTFHYRIPMFAHEVRLPIRSNPTHAARASTSHPLRAHMVILRQCFTCLHEYCMRRKRKKQGLIKALLFWRRRELMYVRRWT